MARQAMWVHGNSAAVRFPGGNGDPAPSPHTPGHQLNGVDDNRRRIPWSDIVGLRRDGGATFRGRDNAINSFMFSIPTPCWRDGVQARLRMVGFTFSSDAPVSVIGGRVFDADRQLDVDIPGVPPGRQTRLVPNVNRFDFSHDIPVLIAICVILDVRFTDEGDITFHAVGADFDV